MRLTARGWTFLAALLVTAAVALGANLAPANWTAPQIEPGVPCVVGVHQDGSSDVYCGSPAVLPADTLPLVTR